LTVWTVTPAAWSYPDDVTAMRETDKRLRFSVKRVTPFYNVLHFLGNTSLTKLHRCVPF